MCFGDQFNMQNRIRCMAVDDEPLALELISEYIENTPELQLSATTTQAEEVMELVEKHGIELLFLDVQMPRMTGIEVIKKLDGRCAVVLTTAFPQYALDGFELEVVDYLLKPISHERFSRSVQKVLEKFKLDQLRGNESSAQDHFFVKTDYKTQRINYSEVLYIEGLKDYVSIYTDTGRVVSLQVMKKLEEFLPPNRFVRVHRSYIVALDRIRQVEKKRLFIEEREIPIGETYRDQFFKTFQLRQT